MITGKILKEDMIGYLLYQMQLGETLFVRTVLSNLQFKEIQVLRIIYLVEYGFGLYWFDAGRRRIAKSFRIDRSKADNLERRRDNP